MIRVGEAGATYAEASCGAEKVKYTGTVDGIAKQSSGKNINDLFTVNAGDEQENTVDGDALLTEVLGVGVLEGSESATISVRTKEEVKLFF